jgi:osmotically inducible protein OsmC
MARIERIGEARWEGNLREGQGTITTVESKVLDAEAYSFGTRFREKPGTNPEELIAAAHAACYSMAFANVLADRDYKPEYVATRATCALAPKDGGGFEITEMHLEVEAAVPDIDQATFRQLAEVADNGCPVSNLLRKGLRIILDVTLAS